MNTTNKSVPFIVRQGDVLVQRIDNLPANLKPINRDNGRIILAHGEKTNHHHAICDDAVTHYADLDTPQTPASALAPVTYLEVKEAMAALTHEEHATIQLPPGNYRVIRQREYSPAALRNVQD